MLLVGVIKLSFNFFFEKKEKKSILKDISTNLLCKQIELVQNISVGVYPLRWIFYSITVAFQVATTDVIALSH